MTISFDEFKKMDLRVATIMEVEEIPEADKLLKLTVNAGDTEPRTIVAGVKNFLEDYEILVDKQVVVLANLEPKELMGVESQGMLLACGKDEEFSLLVPEGSVTPGTSIR